MTSSFEPNIYQVSESFAAMRQSRRRAYMKAALAELNATVGPEYGAVALSLGMAEIWQDHADGVYEVVG